MNITTFSTDVFSMANTTGEDEASTVVLGSFLSMVGIGTIGGNLLVIMAVGMVKKLRTPSNFLIVSLALSDFLVGILVLPFAIMEELIRRWPFGERICDVFLLFDVLLCTASILNLCAISIDRYLAITKPLQYAAKRTPQRMIMMIISVWVASALISIPPIFGFKEVFKEGECQYSDNWVYQIYATCCAFYIPLLVMLVLYGRIFVLARRMAQEDAKQKRATQSLSQPQIRGSIEFQNGQQQHEASPVENGQQKCPPNGLSKHHKEVRSKGDRTNVQQGSERYPLPPSDSCRRSKPRPLHPDIYYKSTEDTDPTPHMFSVPNTSDINHTEELGGLLREIRRSRAEYFAAPPSRHCSSIIFPLKRHSNNEDRGEYGAMLNTSTGNDCFYNPHALHTSSSNRPPLLHQSQSMRGGSTNYSHEKFSSSKPRLSVPPPTLSVSYFGDDIHITTSPSQGSVSLTVNTDIGGYFRSRTPSLHSPKPLLPVNETYMTPQLLRPRPRPLHGARSSLTNTSADLMHRERTGRLNSLLVTSSKHNRRLSSPWEGPRGNQFENLMKRTSIGRSMSRLIHHPPEVPPGGEQSRAGSVSSIHNSVPRRRKSHGHPGETKAIRTLGVIMGCFCLCWIPFFIIALVQPLYRVITKDPLLIPRSIHRLFLWLGYINSTLNPIIYAIFNQEFRIPFKEILLCRCRGMNARLRSQRYAKEFGVRSSAPNSLGARQGSFCDTVGNGQHMGLRRKSTHHPVWTLE